RYGPVHAARVRLVFDRPAILGLPPGELGLRAQAHIDKRLVAADAHDAAPGARADERAQIEHAVGSGEDVAIAAGMLIDDHIAVAVQRLFGIPVRHAVAGLIERPHLSGKAADDHLAHEAAAVVADVHHHALLGEL